MSTASWRASVVQSIDVAAANSLRHIVLTTGGRSERFAESVYPDLPEMAFVQMGIFTGDSLKRCVERGVPARHGLRDDRQARQARHRADADPRRGRRRRPRVPRRPRPRRRAPEPLARSTIAGANTARHVEELSTASGFPALYDRIAARAAARLPRPRRGPARGRDHPLRLRRARSCARGRARSRPGRTHEPARRDRRPRRGGAVGARGRGRWRGPRRDVPGRRASAPAARRPDRRRDVPDHRQHRRSRRRLSRRGPRRSVAWSSRRATLCFSGSADGPGRGARPRPGPRRAGGLRACNCAFARVGLLLARRGDRQRPRPAAQAERSCRSSGRPKIGLFTRDGDSPSEVARFFVDRGLDDYRASVGEDLGAESERLTALRGCAT